MKNLPFIFVTLQRNAPKKFQRELRCPTLSPHWPPPLHQSFQHHVEMAPRWPEPVYINRLHASASGPSPTQTPPPPRVKTSEPRSDRQLSAPATAAAAGGKTEDVMDSAVGPHFSGLRLDSRRLSSSSLPSPTSFPSANGTADAARGVAPPKADGTRQPFVIGTRNRLAAAAPRRLVYLSLVLGIFRLPCCGFDF